MTFSKLIESCSVLFLSCLSYKTLHKEFMGRESGKKPPLSERGCSCRMYQDVLKENFAVLILSFCCSLDGQDVLNISVL